MLQNVPHGCRRPTIIAAMACYLACTSCKCEYPAFSGGASLVRGADRPSVCPSVTVSTGLALASSLAQGVRTANGWDLKSADKVLIGRTVFCQRWVSGTCCLDPTLTETRPVMDSLSRCGEILSRHVPRCTHWKKEASTYTL